MKEHRFFGVLALWLVACGADQKRPGKPGSTKRPAADVHAQAHDRNGCSGGVARIATVHRLLSTLAATAGLRRRLTCSGARLPQTVRVGDTTCLRSWPQIKYQGHDPRDTAISSSSRWRERSTTASTPEPDPAPS